MTKVSPHQGFYTRPSPFRTRRVYLPASLEFWGTDKYEEANRFHRLAKRLSIWHGADTRLELKGVSYFGYEISQEDWPRAAKLLLVAGLSLKLK